MKTKIAAVFGMLLLLAGVLSGCSFGQTPEKVLASVEKQTALTPPTTCRTDLSLSVDMNGEGVTIPFVVEVAGETKEDMQNKVVYTASTSRILVDGEASETVTETYSLAEGDAFASYTKMGTMWIRSEIPASALSALYESPELTGEMVIDKEDAEYGGKKAICLVSSLSGDEITDLCGSLLSSLSDALGVDGVDLDFSPVTGEARLYIDKETMLPLHEKAVISGLDEALNRLLAASPDYEGFSFAMRRCEMTVDYTSFEPVSGISLPADAKEKAQYWQTLLAGGPLERDGYVTFYYLPVIWEAACPDGYEFPERGYWQTGVGFQKKGGRTVTFDIDHDEPGNGGANLREWVYAFADDVASMGMSCSREDRTAEIGGRTFEVCTFTVSYSGRKTVTAYAWTRIGSDENADYYLMFETSDFGNGSTVTDAEIDELLALARPSDLAE